MSVWTTVKGKISGKHLSVRKLVNEHFDEVVFSQTGLSEYEFSYSSEGHDAFNVFHTFLLSLKEYQARHDLEITIRFVR